MHHLPRQLLLALLLGSAAVARVHAQDSASVAGPPCDGAIVSDVDVETHGPEFKGRKAWWRNVARFFGFHHDTTSRGIVRRFVTLESGEECTEFRRSESERILRGQPYIADATVATTRFGDSVRVDVCTIDEMAVLAHARFRGVTPQALTLGTLNFRGAGLRLEGRWEEGDVYRDGWGGQLAHYQMFGKPYAFVIDGMRHPLGEYFATSLSHAFMTDLQRIAWYSGYSVSKDYPGVQRPDSLVLLLPTDRSLWSVGGVVRIGPPRRLLLVGAILLGEHVVPHNNPLAVDSSTGLFEPKANTGVRTYPVYQSSSIAGVLGVRALRFSRMRLDALGVDQDVATGSQIGAILGMDPTSGPIGRQFATFDVYGGARTKRNFVGMRTQIESRLDLSHHNWQHLIGSGRLAWYYTPFPRWLSLLSAEFAGGWRTVVPFQLPLGDRGGGVHGYARSIEAGAQRVVTRLEQRVDVGRFRETKAAFGAAAFAEAGRVWAGDVPFGVTTPIRTSVGLAILGAIPATSRRTARAEIAIPLSGKFGHAPEFRFAMSQPIDGFWRDPPALHWARLALVPEQIFSWP